MKRICTTAGLALAGFLFAGPAEAAVRKCSAVAGFTVDPVSYLMVDGVIRGEFGSTGNSVGNMVYFTTDGSVSIPARETGMAEIRCLQVVDGDQRELKQVVSITTDAHMPVFMEANLKDVVALQDRQMRSNGRYAATLMDMGFFNDHSLLTPIRMIVVEGGFSATYEYPGVACHVMVGAIAAPREGLRPGEVGCFKS